MNKSIKLHIKDGGHIVSIYDDALVPLISEAASTTTTRASHVEPCGANEWSADMSPINGQMLIGFKTRAAALDAEREYINEFLLTGILPAGQTKGN